MAWYRVNALCSNVLSTLQFASQSLHLFFIVLFILPFPMDFNTVGCGFNYSLISFTPGAVQDISLLRPAVE